MSECPTLVIAGSVRPTRIAPQVAEWIAAIARETTGRPFETVDLADWRLPMDDEPGMPQYNGGYPAALKNAIDHLFTEWAGKPALIVTFGGHGGGRGGEQLAQVCSFVKMRPLETRPALTVSRGVITGNNGQIDPATEFAAHRKDVLAALAEFAAALAARIAGDDAPVITR